MNKKNYLPEVIKMILETVPDDRFEVWLKSCFLGEPTPHINLSKIMPSDFRRPGEFLLLYLRHADKNDLMKFGDAALEIIKKLTTNNLNSLSENQLVLLQETLYFLERVPTSNAQELISNLEKLIKSTIYINQPDCREEIVRALINQLPALNQNSTECEKWSDIMLGGMAQFPRHTVAMFAALSRVSIREAIRKLPSALEKLNELNLSSYYLCSDLARQIGDDPKTWKQVVSILDLASSKHNFTKQSPFEKAKKYFEKALKKKNLSQSFSVFINKDIETVIHLTPTEGYLNKPEVKVLISEIVSLHNPYEYYYKNYPQTLLEIEDFFQDAKIDRERICQQYTVNGQLGIVEDNIRIFWNLIDIIKVTEIVKKFFEGPVTIYLANLIAISNDKDVYETGIRTGETLAELANSDSSKLRFFWRSILNASENTKNKTE